MGKELEILLLTHGDWGKYIIDAGKMIVGNVDRVSQIYAEEQLQMWLQS